MEEKKKQDQMAALMNAIFAESIRGYSLQPKLGISRKYKFRDAMVDERICEPCFDAYGRVFPAETAPTTQEIRRRSHPFCRCRIEWLRSIQADTATVSGDNGADYAVKQTGHLPERYLSKEKAIEKGWINQRGNLWEILPGISLYEEHKNRKKKLPTKQGRTWYEADINYHGGYRNTQRLLFSDDGLIFVTYDHYQTYFEII